MKHTRHLICLVLLLLGGGVHAQSPLHVFQETGPRSKRINLVYLSEGYTQAELNAGLFEAKVEEFTSYLFSKEPWSRYRSYFNVYGIEVASQESGTDNPHASPAYSKNTYFGSGFHPVIERLLVISSAGSKAAYTLLNKHVPEYSIPVVIVNDETYGGSGGPIAVASVEEYGKKIVEHEIGHSFANLADEYDFDTPGYPAIEYPNATAKKQRAQIPWNIWINPDTKVDLTKEPWLDYYGDPILDPITDEPIIIDVYTPEDTWERNPELVGLFEGANYREKGWFRPHFNALMRTLGRLPGAVTREAFIQKFYGEVSPVDGFTPATLAQAITQRTPLSFSVEAKAPSEGSPLQVVWKIDGVVQNGVTGNTFAIPSQNVGPDGKHTITAEVRDTTTWVRRDPKSLLKKTITWTLTLSNQGEPPVIHEAPVARLAVVGGMANFEVDASPAPGSASLAYQWYKDGKAIATAKTDSFSIPAVKLTDGGVYKVRVTSGSVYIEKSADLVVVDDHVQTLVLAEGKAATLSPPVTGPVLSYQWLHRGAPITALTSGFPAKQTFSPLVLATHRGTFSLKLVTAGGTETYDTHFLDIFSAPPQLSLSAGASLPAGRVGAGYGENGEGVQIGVVEIEGRPASAFAASGLPPGLKVDTKTGLITGKPTAAKKDKAGQDIPYAVTLSAGNGKGTSKVTVNLLIASLPAGTIGTFAAHIDRGLPALGANGALGGRIDVTTAANGSYSGKLVLGAQTFSFKGSLEALTNEEFVRAGISIPRAGKPAPPPLELAFEIYGPDWSIEGDLDLAGETLHFFGWGNPWSKTHPAGGYDGYHTFRLGLPESTLGSGFGSFTIGLDGKTTISGRTADNETFTSAGHVGPQGELMIFSLQKGKPQGSITGKFELSDKADIDDTESPNEDDDDDSDNRIDTSSALISWWKPASTDPKARLYKELGFGPVNLEITGGRYQEPVAPKVALDVALNADVELAFMGASLPGRLSASVDIQAKSKAVVQAAFSTTPPTLVINPKLGTFSGKVTLLNNNPRGIAPLEVSRAMTYQGIIVPNGSHLVGEGFFLLPDLPSVEKQDTPTTSPVQSGKVEMAEQN